MKVAHLNVTGEFGQELKAKIEKVASYQALTKPNLTAEEALEVLKDAEVAILAPASIKPIDERLIGQCAKLRHIALVTVGYDTVDLEACKKRGISISRPVGANAQAVAEHTIGMMLDVAKRITEFDRDLRQKGAYDFRNYMGIELTGRTLGILGLGAIGGKVARMAKRALEMRVMVYDRSEKSNEEYQVVNMNDLIVAADVISVHLPLTNETKDFIGSDELSKVKPGAILINTAREEIVNKEAVLGAIESGMLGGYTVETNVMTPISPDDDYLKYPNVLVNPHNAFNTKETQVRVDRMVVDNVVSFIEGKPKNILRYE